MEMNLRTSLLPARSARSGSALADRRDGATRHPLRREAPRPSGGASWIYPEGREFFCSPFGPLELPSGRPAVARLSRAPIVPLASRFCLRRRGEARAVDRHRSTRSSREATSPTPSARQFARIDAVWGKEDPAGSSSRTDRLRGLSLDFRGISARSFALLTRAGRPGEGARPHRVVRGPPARGRPRRGRSRPERRESSAPRRDQRTETTSPAQSTTTGGRDGSGSRPRIASRTAGSGCAEPAGICEHGRSL